MGKLRCGKLACHGGHGDYGGAGGVFQRNRIVTWKQRGTQVLWLRGDSRIGNREARGASRRHGHDGGHGGALAGTHPRWRNVKCGLPKARL